MLNLSTFSFKQDLLDDWTSKGTLVEEINHKGTSLENLITEITAPDSPAKTGEWVLQNVVDKCHSSLSAFGYAFLLNVKIKVGYKHVGPKAVSPRNLMCFLFCFIILLQLTQLELSDEHRRVENGIFILQKFDV